ncbi:hypothetical protein EDD16DRAFT_342693 [Pisolithus croceorrhizus]|nr:hypothetical protein EDD16DRAFT_342693 [Pisolithus croceorrhizus]
MAVASLLFELSSGASSLVEETTPGLCRDLQAPAAGLSHGNHRASPHPTGSRVTLSWFNTPDNSAPSTVLYKV